MFRRPKPQLSWTPPTSKKKYPKWAIVKIEDKYYLILDTYKLEFISERAAASWGRPPVLGTEESLSGYKTWKRVGFAPGTVVRSLAGVAYYISGKTPIECDKLRITTPDFFTELGFSSGVVISDQELQFHKDGGSIDSVSL